MALTSSIMVALGFVAPNFSLPNVMDGSIFSLESVPPRKGLLVVFLCSHCPYVEHLAEELGKLSLDYSDSEISMVGISSNDIRAYPEDSPANLKQTALDNDWRFPVLFDETQQVAKDYHATCTPDFFLFDRDRKLVYRGQFDASRPGNGIEVTGQDLRAAMESLLSEKPVSRDQKPSVGCNIKWKVRSV